ncbi:MAG: hypothetical protein N3G22_03685 [Candidatus Micrarchaeota archaeon]|nr:hypothetical protein [Candidatus Micrarchaeota archaeon]
MKRMLMLPLAVLLLVAVANAQQQQPPQQDNSPLSGLQAAIQSLCTAMQQLLPVVAMLMVLVAGVIYAAGQIMGAETRARANVWATAALTGALIALLIFAVAPPILGQLSPTGGISC